MNIEKVRFVILKETQKGGILPNITEEKFDNLDLGFSWNEFVNQVNFLVNEKHLTRPLYTDNTISFYNSVLTEKGETYLKNNQWHKKIYNAATEIRKWIY